MRSPPLILIVEDTPASLEIMDVRLSAQGYRVITAKDGEEGLAMTRQHKPDLILLDILMPKMDGLEVCRQIKSDSSLPFIPIIFVTAKTDSQDIVAGLGIGGDDYLTKPVNHTALVARVKSMLRIKELHDTVLDQSDKLKRQLKTATKIQTLFWPELPLLGGNFKIWAVSTPAGYVGGDLYDVILLPDGSLLTYVADVSDKGVPAALIMAALSTIIKSESLRHETIETLIRSVNRRLVELASDEGHFATIILVRFWHDTGRLQLVRAGHPYPLHIVKGKMKEIPQLTGISLGVDSDADYKKEEITLGENESILLFSDGVLEATNQNLEHFGAGQLCNHIATQQDPPWGPSLIKAVDEWSGTSDAHDDITIVEIWNSTSS